MNYLNLIGFLVLKLLFLSATTYVVILLPSVAEAQSPVIETKCPQGTREFKNEFGLYCFDANNGRVNPIPANQEVAAYDTCGWWDFEFGRCIWVPFLSWLGSLFVVIGGSLLQLAGWIFNTLIQYLIVGFGDTIKQLELLDGIHEGWEVLRDISNIVIIGMFVFIAISMILGLEEFGAKRLVAHVLIIAVLINFSLLFSKLIIDTGNFFAYQFYKSLPASVSNSGDKNIADNFLNIIGITSVWDSYKVVSDYGEKARFAGAEEIAKQTFTDSKKRFEAFQRNATVAGFKALMYGLTSGALLLFAAAVIFYGCYLIATRAILLIFLMLVSALAFASWLVPKLGKSGYGWSIWWQSLINASIFAPILMMLLYVSLLILKPAQRLTKGSLGEIAADPSSIAGNWKVFIIFIFGIGMLFVSFKVANSFSKQIAGFSTAGVPVGRGIGLATGLAARMARFGIGGTAGRILNTKAIMGLSDNNVLKRSLGRIASSSFNPLNLPGVAKYGGIDFGKVKGEGGYFKDLETKQKKILERDIAIGKMGTKETRADRKRQSAIDEQKEGLQKAEKALADARTEAGKTTPTAQKTATTEKAEPAKVPSQRGAYSALPTERDRADDAKRARMEAAASKDAERVATSVGGANIARSAQQVAQRQQQAQEIGKAIAEVLARGGQGTLDTPMRDIPENANIERIKADIATRTENLKKMIVTDEKGNVPKDDKGNIIAVDKYGVAARKEAYIKTLGEKGLLSFFPMSAKDRQAKVSSGMSKTEFEHALEKLAKDLQESNKRGAEKITAAVRESAPAASKAKPEAKPDH